MKFKRFFRYRKMSNKYNNITCY